MSRASAIKLLNAELAPFRLVDTGKTCSFLLTELGMNANLFATRAADGFEGNGYDWESVASVVLAKADPQLQNAVKFDSEGSMFCAYGQFEEIAAFARLFKDVATNSDRFVEALKEAEVD